MGTTTLASYLQHQSFVAFSAEPFYEKLTDSLILYIRNEPSFARRISKYFTLFLSHTDKSLVGFEIKGVSVICKALESDQLKTIAGPIEIQGESGAGYSLEVLFKTASLNEEVEIGSEQMVQLKSATRGKVVPTSKLSVC